MTPLLALTTEPKFHLKIQHTNHKMKPQNQCQEEEKLGTERKTISRMRNKTAENTL